MTRLMDPCFFIGGMPRSGTTLISSMLSGHPKITVTPETHLYDKYFFREHRFLWKFHNYRKRFLKIYFKQEVVPYFNIDTNDQEKLLNILLQCNDFDELIFTIIDFFKENRKKAFGGEKTPMHIFSADHLLSINTKSKFILIVRDPRDTILSLDSMNWWNYSTEQTSRIWKKCSSTIRFLENKYPDRTMVIKYESLIANPEKILKSASKFLDITYSPLMMEFQEISRQEINLKNEPWKKGNTTSLIRDNSNRWKEKMNTNRITIIQSIAGNEMEYLDYPMNAPAQLVDKSYSKNRIKPPNISYRLKYWRDLISKK